MHPVLHSFNYALDYLREQLEGLTPAQMVAQPNGISNHPAWVVGHLAFTCQMLGEVIGVPPWLPAGWEKRFGTGSVPVADAGAYETKEQALAILADARSRITRAVEALDDAQLDQPFPDPSYLYVFPTVRHALTQVLVGHTSMHVGQLTVWRRAMALPAMSRSFE
jgi:hypothetical protein